MNTRRTILTQALALAGTTQPFGTGVATANGAVSPGAMSYPLTAAEAASKVVPTALQYAPGDVRRYGLVANDSNAAEANARALRALVDPAGTFTGNICFPNATGFDVYHFNDVIPFHDDIHVDLQASTLEFSKVASAADSNSGFIFAVRNFSIENGSIVVKYNMGTVATSAGSAIHIGNRGSDSAHFSPTFDSLLKTPMGNVTIRNVRITSDVANGNGIEMTGGLVGVIVENVWVDGQSALAGGIYYEFGWATSGTTNLRQTSHAHNMRFVNISVTNLKATAGAAITLAGAYNCLVDGLYVNGAAAAFAGTSGESLFYRPWAGVDQAGAKRTVALRNIVAQKLSGNAIMLGGAQAAANGYLAARALTPVAETDLGDYSLDGFAVDGTSAGWGIFITAGRADIRNGHIYGFQRGIVQSDDCTRIIIDSVDVVGCTQTGMQFDIGAAIWKPPRQKMGEIRNCFIAGNSTQVAGSFPGIKLDTCVGFLIEGNRIGFERGHDGVFETTQGHAIELGARCNNVLCRGNYVGGVSAGGVAYYNITTDTARGNAVQTPGGTITTNGSWDGITVKRRTVAFAPSITIDSTGSEQYDVTATSAVRFVINAPMNPVSDKIITVTIRNASGGTLGEAVWNAIFKMSPWSNPGNDHNRSVTFRFDGVHWLQIAQTGVDVPN